jgi:hypothetical protein
MRIGCACGPCRVLPRLVEGTEGSSAPSSTTTPAHLCVRGMIERALEYGKAAHGSTMADQGLRHSSPWAVLNSSPCLLPRLQRADPHSRLVLFLAVLELFPSLPCPPLSSRTPWAAASRTTRSRARWRRRRTRRPRSACSASARSWPRARYPTRLTSRSGRKRFVPGRSYCLALT